MEVLFTYDPDHEIKDLRNVELMISPGNSILTDPFRNNEQTNPELDQYSMSCIDNNNKFVKTLFLSVGMYHYLYKVVTKDEAWLTIGSSKYKTVLASGRKVNYMEVGALSPRSNHSFSDCLPNIPDEDSPLLSTQKENKKKENTKRNKRSGSMCCCSSPVTSP